MTKPIPRHPDATVIDDWANELAQKLKLPPEEIFATSYIDNGGKQVVIRYDDGSQAVYRCAIAVWSSERKQVAVFTEHCGYLVFKLLPDMEVIEQELVVGEWQNISHYIQPYR